MQKRKSSFLRKCSIVVFSMLTMVAGVFPTRILGYDEEIKNTVPENIDDSSNHLSDYSEKYGYEPIGNKAQVTLQNKNEKAAVPQKVAYLAVFVEFKGMDDVKLDDEDTVKAADMVLNSGGINKTGYGDAPVSSLKDYIKKYSYGNLDIKGDVFPKKDGKVLSYTSDKPREYFKKYHAVSNPGGYKNVAEEASREKELIEGALAAVKPSIENEFTADEIDSGRDGIIDAISFFAEAPDFDAPIRDDVEWGDLLWSHKSSVSSDVKINGKSIDGYNLIGINDPKGRGSEFSYEVKDGVVSLVGATYGVVHHEYFHTLGLPDLYRGTSSGSPVGYYDIMADSNNMNPQGITSIMQRDWLTWGSKLEEVTNTKVVKLKRPKYVDGTEKTAVKIYSPLNANEYFIVEFYEKPKFVTPQSGRADGLLAYRINNNVGGGNISGGTDGKDDYMYIFRPNEVNLGNGAGTIKDAVILPTVNNTYGSTDITSQAWDKNTLFYSDGINSGIQLKVVESSNDEIAVEITLPNVEGSGTETDPYLISKPADLNLIENNPKAYYKVMKDIDFTGFDFKTISALEGSFDGNNKTFSNITIAEGRGIFGIIEYAANLKNLKIENISVKNTSENHTGALAANIGGTVKNVGITSGDITVTDDSAYEYQGVGGFAGTANDSAIIENCYTNASVTNGRHVGGFVGLNSGATYKDNFASGLVEAGVGKVGGFIGGEFFIGTPVRNFTNCAYDGGATGQSMPQDGIDVVPGITGFKVNEEILLDLSGVNEGDIGLETSPEVVGDLETEVEFGSTGIATFDTTKQKVIGVGVGTTFMFTKIEIGTNALKLKSNIEVIDTKVDVPITGITLNNNTLELQLSGEETLLATINPVNTTDDKTLVWSTSDANTVSVDQNGKVTAVKAGTATITVTTSNNKQASCVVSVKSPITSVSLNTAKLLLAKGTQDTLVATINPVDTTDDKTLTWSTSDANIVRVDQNGKLTALNTGTASITVTTSNNMIARCEVSVDIPATSIALDKTNVTLTKGESTKVNATLNPVDSTSQATWSWTSNDVLIATVDGNGNISGVSEGQTFITVSATLKQRIVLEAKIPVTVVKTLFEQIQNKYDLGNKNINDPAFIAGAPRSFIDYLQIQLDAAQVIINAGEGNTPDQDISAQIAAIDHALMLFTKVGSINEMKQLLALDLTAYDTDSIAGFLAMKDEMQAIVNDPFTNQDKIDSGLLKLKSAVAKFEVLDSQRLKAAISKAIEIDILNYLDGKEIDAFIEAFNNAQDALDATTNKAYEDALSKLEKSMMDLEKVKLMSAEQLAKIQMAQKELNDLLLNGSISATSRQAIEDLLKQIDILLANPEALSIDADSLLIEVKNVKKSIVEEILEKTPSTQITNVVYGVPTGDNTGLTILYIMIFSSMTMLVFLTLKNRKEKASNAK